MKYVINPQYRLRGWYKAPRDCTTPAEKKPVSV